ncbi:hypothetical protein NUU61_005484 [Penicillium alfredii]|uniref:Uncharacterized protein n=1 Tax=Penicillium alfredii TaxID=1506179 RepID=A0A9W9F9L5_9EURO|nr:uncharacterized protein NUU61_005484 [Penicillium alfredii]KAJ5096128.1 hypothetical protein NUU61_005484 [Penicillium alfredii]
MVGAQPAWYPLQRQVKPADDYRTEIPTAKISHPKPSRWEAIFRAFGLSIIYAKLHSHNEEQPKVAIWKSRRVALPKLLLHVIPVLGCSVLLWLNLSGYYLGTEITGIEGHNNAKLGAIQFAAKTHEITIMASLGMIVFSMVQNRIVSRPAAFGTVLSGLQFEKLSYLWSRELWEIISVEWSQPSGKLFIGTLLVAMFLAPTVGPSSAVLMVPRVDDLQAGGTDFWLNATREQLWPAEVSDSGVDPTCLVDEGKTTCPAAGWKGLGSAVFPAFEHLTPPGPYYSYIQFPGEVYLLGKYGFRSMFFNVRGYFDVTLASCPSAVVADSLALASMYWQHASECPSWRKHFNWWNRASWSVKGVQQPVTNVACIRMNLTDQLTAPHGVFAALGGGISFPVFDTYRWIGDISHYDPVNYTDPRLLSQVAERLTHSTHPELLWLPLNQTRFGNNSVGVIATFPPSEKFNTTNVISCEVDSRWLNANQKITREYKVDSTWTSKADFFYELIKNRARIPLLPRIQISPQWAKYVNPRLPLSNQTVFEQLLMASGLWNIQPEGESHILAPSDAALGDVVEAALAGMVNNGLANLSPMTSIQGTRPGDELCTDAWIDPLMPQGPSAFGKGGMFWNMDGIDTSNMTKFTMEVIVNGYAYSVKGATSIAAMVVMLVYCLMVIPHTIYVVRTGRSSSSWDSLPEIVALALQSRPTAALKNTGAGISTSAIFRAPVQVLGMERRLTLAFGDTQKGGTPVKENEAYE